MPSAGEENKKDPQTKDSPSLVPPSNLDHRASDEASTNNAYVTNRDDNDDDIDTEVVLPTLKYGYRTEPLDWPELMDIVVPPPPRTPNLDRLCRSRQQQYDYEVYKQRHIKGKWRSVYDFVLCGKFDRPVGVDTETGLKYAMDDDDDDKNHNAATTNEASTKLVVVLNDFPYCLVPQVQHWVLWKLGGGHCTDEEISKAKEEIRLKVLESLALETTTTNAERESIVVDFLHWINPPHLQSLPDIDHVHILSRCNTTTSQAAKK